MTDQAPERDERTAALKRRGPSGSLIAFLVFLSLIVYVCTLAIVDDNRWDSDCRAQGGEPHQVGRGAICIRDGKVVSTR